MNLTPLPANYHKDRVSAIYTSLRLYASLEQRSQMKDFVSVVNVVTVGVSELAFTVITRLKELRSNYHLYYFHESVTLRISISFCVGF